MDIADKFIFGVMIAFIIFVVTGIFLSEPCEKFGETTMIPVFNGKFIQMIPVSECLDKKQQ